MSMKCQVFVTVLSGVSTTFFSLSLFFFQSEKASNEHVALKENEIHLEGLYTVTYKLTFIMYSKMVKLVP